MTNYGVWSPYVGIGAVTLAVLLLVIAVIFAFLGTRLYRPIGCAGQKPRPPSFTQPSVAQAASR